MIVLVVFGHHWLGLWTSGLIPDALFVQVESRIYAFHMPVFFALAGWFFLSSLNRATLAEFSLRRLERLLWPMILWTYIFLIFKILAGSMANSPTSLADLWVIPIPGMLHLWFLWTMLILSFAFIPLKLFLVEGRVSLVALIAIGCLVLSIQFVLRLPPHVTEWVGNAIGYAPFFFLGMVLGQFQEKIGFASLVKFPAVLIFLALVAFWPVVAMTWFNQVGSLVLTLCVLVMFSNAEPLTSSGLTKKLNLLGKASMAIYLAHTIFSAATREVMFAFGIENLAAHLVLGTLTGLVGPLVLFNISKRTGTTRVLGF